MHIGVAAKPMERTTRQRGAISAAIEQAQRPLSPQEILDGARAAVPGIGMATVYRCLRRLQSDGKVRAVELPGHAPRYEPAAGGHHHHFHCSTCDRLFDVHACPGEMNRLAPQGFLVEHHDLTLHGRCADCLRREAA
jgi:Fur family transcriptional regulator, ferric uptake regulator